MGDSKRKIRKIIYRRTFSYFLITLATFVFLHYSFSPIANYFFPEKFILVPGGKVEDIAPDNFDERLILIGDAGDMKQSVIEAVQDFLGKRSKDVSIIYLGDNVYTYGIPDESKGDAWRGAVEKLFRQIDPFLSFTRNIYFIPGNHDWDNSNKDGWKAVKRQQQLVESKLGQGHFLPRGGCPGPELINVSKSLRVIALDSHWWVHSWDKPSRPEDGCDVYTKEAVVEKFEKMLADNPENIFTVIAQHHPLVGYGIHAMHASCPNDMGCPVYRDMKERLRAIIRKYRPPLCAAGHDHGVQVLRIADECGTDVVTGGGTALQRVEAGKGTIYAADTLGFMLLDRKAATWRLTSIEVPLEGQFAGGAKWKMSYSEKLRF